MTTRVIVFAAIAAVATGVVSAAPLEAPVAATHDESKPLGPIAVQVRLAGTPELGVSLAVIVAAHADAAAVDRLGLEVRSDDPAALVIGAQSGPVDGAGARSWVVTVVPVRAAGGNLSVVVAGEIGGVAQAQSVTTKIRPAGALPAVSPLSTRPTEAGAENLSLLPVEERF